MNEKIIVIQPKQQDHEQEPPYPFQISPTGEVLYQAYWKGTPLALIGFNPTPTPTPPPKEATQLPFHKFQQTPNKALGLFPVFQNEDGTISVHNAPIESMRVIKNNPY